MRLLNVSTRRFETFPDDIKEIPDYAILSHTWIRPNDQEVLYEDIARNIPFEHKAGNAKVEFVCKQATVDDLGYVWIDTCCIDKSSTMDVKKSINSMFRYYTNSSVCYVYLSDVEFRPSRFNFGRVSREWREQLAASKWLTRGWTLQELIAPAKVAFFEANGDFLGTRHDLRFTISKITGIDQAALRNRASIAREEVVQSFSVAQRFCWAASRVTTEPEDISYCLIGLFKNVYLEPRYGEGAEQAFKRLQIEIMAATADESILAWDGAGGGLLAPSPRCFMNSADVVPSMIPDNHLPYLEFNRTGLNIPTRLIRTKDLPQKASMPVMATHVMLLDCEYGPGRPYVPCVYLVLTEADRPGEMHFFPTRGTKRMSKIHMRYLNSCEPTTIFITVEAPLPRAGVDIVLETDRRKTDIERLDSAPNGFREVAMLDPNSFRNGAVVEFFVHPDNLYARVIAGARFRFHRSGLIVDLIFESDRVLREFRLLGLQQASVHQSVGKACWQMQSRLEHVQRPWHPWPDFETATAKDWNQGSMGRGAITLSCGRSCKIIASDSRGWLALSHRKK